MRPRIICHMASSLDGRILPSRWSPKGAHSNDLYDQLHTRLGGGSWLVGRVTGEEFARGNGYPSTTDATFPREAWLPHQDAAAYGISITRKADMKTVDGPADYFTGKVTITGQFQRDEPSRVGGAIVHFEPGARTAWHKHPLGQALIVTEGVGWTQVEGGPVLEFHAGDVLWCPRDQKHWHGATPHEGMTHIAIQESHDGSPVTWMEQVSDEDYLAGPSH